MNILLPIFQQATQPTSSTSSFLINLLPILAIIVIFYFLLILPQNKQKKKHEEMIRSLDKGDEVITTSGIFGTVVGVKEDSITIKVDDNTTIRILKGAVASVKKREE
ncbi:MAG: preprotein translocase subunit YajC [Spirochaetota bacterium]